MVSPQQLAAHVAATERLKQDSYAGLARALAQNGLSPAAMGSPMQHHLPATPRCPAKSLSKDQNSSPRVTSGHYTAPRSHAPGRRDSAIGMSPIRYAPAKNYATMVPQSRNSLQLPPTSPFSGSSASRPVIRIQSRLPPNTVARKAPRKSTTTIQPHQTPVQGVKRRAETHEGRQVTKVRRTSNDTAVERPRAHVTSVKPRQIHHTPVKQHTPSRTGMVRARPIILDDDDEDEAVLLALNTAQGQATMRQLAVADKPNVVQKPAAINTPKSVQEATSVEVSPYTPKHVSAQKSTRTTEPVVGQEPATIQEPVHTQEAVSVQDAAHIHEPVSIQASPSVQDSSTQDKFAGSAPAHQISAAGCKLLRPRYNYTMPWSLRGVQVALGRDTWNEYLAAMEAKCMGQMSEQELGRKSKALFAVPTQRLREKINGELEDIVKRTLFYILRDAEEDLARGGNMPVLPSIEI